MYSEDPAKIADFIRSVDPDIVCLQELTKGYMPQYPDVGAYIAERLGYQAYYDYGPMVLPTGEQTEMGMGIFSKLELQDTQKLVLQSGIIEQGKVIADERFYLQAVITSSGQSITVGTTHLPFHPRFQTTPPKLAMAETILKFNKGDNYILAGDFNTTPHTKAARAFRQSGLKNAGPALTQPTWTTKPFEIGPWSYEALRWRLDYVLYGGSLRTGRAEILPTDLSDHLPILVECSVQSA
jgi:endonuclease/exonuclease/phosphatase family metal-dependent hydrolase